MVTAQVALRWIQTLKGHNEDGKVVVIKDEVQEEPSLVMSEQQESPELRCMESSGHNRESQNNHGRTVLRLEAEGVKDRSLLLFCLCYFY